MSRSRGKIIFSVKLETREIKEMNKEFEGDEENLSIRMSDRREIGAEF